MYLDGNTVFAGDSITVGLAPHVLVDGDKLTIAKVGQSSSALRNMMRDAEAKKALDGFKHLVALAGTNDIGAALTPETIFGNLKSIWAIGKVHGLKVVAITIPPAVGYSGWKGRDVAVDTKRRAVNELIKASSIPDRIVDLDRFIATSDGRLQSEFDSGDHLHPRKDKLGAVLNSELNFPLVISNVPANNFGISPIATVAAGTAIGVGALGIGWGIYSVWKR